MADTLRIKRRVTGSPGAPGSLANAELAYNEVDHILYYGEGTGGTGGTATVVVGIGGQGLASSALPVMNGTAAAGSASAWSRGDHVHPSDTSRAPLANPSFTGTVTIGGTIGGPGMVAWSAAPGPIGSTTPSTGVFTNLSASGTLSGAGFTALVAPYAPLASPSFTGTVTIGGTITGPGMTSWAAAPPPIGSTTPNTGAFTNLNVTGTLSGAGFTNMLAPYAPLASPVFTGTPSLPTGTIGVTQANGTSNTSLATTAFVMSVRLDQNAAPTASVNFNSQNIINLKDPVNPQDGATKNYVDGVAQGIDAKGPVLAATTGANITLSGTQTIDGVALVAGNRVLVKDQTTASGNGIYVVAAAAWTRSTDLDAWSEVPAAFTFVEQGTVNADTGWLCTSDPGGTIGTTAITWVQFSSAGQVTAGNGLTKVGNVISAVGTANRIAVAAAIDIDANYAGQASITTLGSIATGTWNATTIAVNRGGTGATTLTGYLIGNGVGAFTASATIPNTAITGLGTMSTQNANAVAITGGTIDNVTLDCGVF